MHGWDVIACPRALVPLSSPKPSHPAHIFQGFGWIRVAASLEVSSKQLSCCFTPDSGSKPLDSLPCPAYNTWFHPHTITRIIMLSWGCPVNQDSLGQLPGLWLETLQGQGCTEPISHILSGNITQKGDNSSMCISKSKHCLDFERRVVEKSATGCGSHADT